MVKSESADAVELVIGEVLTLRSRVDPLPSAGAGEVEFHNRARSRAGTVLVRRVQPVLGRTKRVAERASVDAAKLLFGESTGGKRGDRSGTAGRPASSEVGAEEGTRESTLAAKRGAMVLSAAGSAEPFDGIQRGRGIISGRRSVLTCGGLRGIGGRRRLLSRRVRRALLADRRGIIGRVFGDRGERSRRAPEGAALGGGRQRGIELGGVNSFKR